jgi:hypothetical protein
MMPKESFWRRPGISDQAVVVKKQGVACPAGVKRPGKRIT